MQGTPSDVLQNLSVLEVTRQTANATVTGAIIDIGKGGVRELLLAIRTGTYTVGSPAVAINLQWFGADKNDMTGEAQIGANRLVTAEMVANTTTYYRVLVEGQKRFQRFKLVFSGGTAHSVDFHAWVVGNAGQDLGAQISTTATLS